MSIDLTLVTVFKNFIFLSQCKLKIDPKKANPTKWSNTLNSSLANFRQIV